MNISSDYFHFTHASRKVNIKADGHKIGILFSPVVDFTDGEIVAERHLEMLKEKERKCFFGSKKAREKIEKFEEAMALEKKTGFLWGRAILQKPGGKTFSETMLFQNRDEFPHLGSRVVLVDDFAPFDWLEQKGFDESIADDHSDYFIRTDDKKGILLWRVACEVDGRMYIHALTEPFVHPLVLKFFEGAVRVGQRS